MGLAYRFPLSHASRTATTQSHSSLRHLSLALSAKSHNLFVQSFQLHRSQKLTRQQPHLSKTSHAPAEAYRDRAQLTVRAHINSSLAVPEDTISRKSVAKQLLSTCIHNSNVNSAKCALLPKATPLRPTAGSATPAFSPVCALS